jgi:hypothetical protein
VWSFGVLVWEMVTLCSIPYMELTSDAAVVQAVVTRGVRLERPDACTEAVFRTLMQPCWAARQQRPSFAALIPAIRRLQEEVLVAIHVEATKPVCAICMDRPISVALVPCGHHCLCDSCSEHFKPPAPCPICRRTVAHILRTFSA